MLFMINGTVLFKESEGITQEVIYLGPTLSDRILKHKIKTQNDTKFLVHGILLSSLDTPDIGIVPVLVEQYTFKLPKLMRLQLEQISHPKTLDDDQHEFMELHNHLPLPAMITLAEKGKLNWKFTKLKHPLPICISCFIGTAYHKPWQFKDPHGSI
jgi:hypothetical protein